MKTKRKEKKKKRKQKKRTGKGSVRTRTQDLRRTGRKLYHKATWNTQKTWSKILSLPRSSLNKREFKDIFQKNDCSFDSENPT